MKRKIRYGDNVKVIGFYNNKYKNYIGTVVGENPYNHDLIEIIIKHTWWLPSSEGTFHKDELEVVGD